MLNTVSDWLLQLIAKPSVTPDDAGCQALISHYLKEQGWQVYPQQCGLASNMYATTSDDVTLPMVLFVGHTDVVPVASHAWLTEPFTPTIKDGRVYGRGACDMKGGIAAMLAAIPILQKTLSPSMRLGLLLTSAEEACDEYGMAQMMHYLNQNEWLCPHHNVVVWVGEPTGQNGFGDTLKYARRGSAYATITANAMSEHSAYPKQHVNAIVEVARVTGLLDQWLSQQPGWDHAAVKIHGGQSNNTTPAQAECIMNVRFPSNMYHHFETYCLQNITPCTTIVHNITSQPYAMDPQHPWVQHVAHYCQKQHGVWPLHADSTSGGTSDARHLAQWFPVVECGPCATSLHQPNEWITLQDLYHMMDALITIVSTWHPNLCSIF
jgi:succinyl-diaminopimelate desuccinylase